MPGVNVTTAVRTGPVGTGDIVAGQFFIVGQTERGPVDAPTLLRSFTDYITYYGNYEDGNMYAHVKTYFDEGGTRCYVQRVVGAGASAGYLDLEDASEVATMRISANNVGDWSDNMTVQVLAGDSTGFRLQFKLDGVVVLTTRDLSSVADAVSNVNASTISHLITASNLTGSSNNPATLAAAAPLDGGDDGTLVGDGSEAITGLDLLSKNYGPGAVALPGLNGTTVWDALRDHAAENNRIALCAFDSADGQSEAKSNAAGYAGDASANHMAFYYPHIKVAAPNVDELATGVTSVAGATVTLSPEAYAAAARTRAVQEVGGPWRAGAGLISSARTLSGLADNLTPAQADLLDAARVNALRTIAGQIRVYGARSASNDEVNWKFITMRDTLNFIVDGVEARMEQFVFETIDGRGNLFGNIRASIKAFLDPIKVSGGLYEAYDDTGALVDPGYSVVVDSTINPATQLATGLVKAQVGVRISSVADLIQVTITKSNLTAPV